MIYANRVQAGRLLAELVKREHLDDPVVLGLTRGGVPVAYEIARQLAAPLDVMVARKIGAPGHPELAIGAVAPDSVVTFDDAVLMLGVPQSYLDATARRERVEVARRLAAIRARHPAVTLRGRTVVLVDDGIATGQTMLAAVGSARAVGAKRVIVAAPVAAAQTVDRLSELADGVICGEVLEDLVAVGLHYQDFSPVSDAAVDALLAHARAERQVGYHMAAENISG